MCKLLCKMIEEITPLGRMGQSEDIADVIEFVVKFEMKTDATFRNHPAHFQEYVEYGGSVAREYVTKQLGL